MKQQLEVIAKLQERNFKVASELLLDAISKLEKEYESYIDNEMDCENYQEIRMVTYAPACKIPSYYSDNLSVFEAYEQPMSLILRAAENSNATPLAERDFNVINAVLLYNHGLCLHLQGLAKGDDSSLEDSLIFYEMALGLLELVEDEPFYFLLEMALLNNYGHVLAYFCDRRHVHQCLRRMHLVLKIATETWEKKVPIDFAHFAHNIIYNGCQHLRPAPAA